MLELGTAEQRHQFMTRHWQDLSGWAYGCYLNSGRGVVAIDLTRQPIELNYSEGNFADETLTAKVQRLIRNYEPSIEIVVVWRCSLPSSQTFYLGKYRTAHSLPGANYKQLLKRARKSGQKASLIGLATPLLKALSV
jgi:hypothetical protein